MKSRCGWGEGSPLMREYHDTEWGFPVADDERLFEKVCLEGFQSGLSWKTVLDKRDDFRRVFHGFDPERVARMGPRDVTRLLGDATIIRHRGKIESTIANARRCLDLIAEKGSLGRYVWDFEPPRRRRAPSARTVSTLVTSPESVALSKDLKKRGWTFVGPTTMYAFMQSMGLVNDHHGGCFAWEPAEAAREKFRIR
ncbi:MAG: DNA-3-methyladenine glycosylase I [Actinomycetota bacterium]